MFTTVCRRLFIIVSNQYVLAETLSTRKKGTIKFRNDQSTALLFDFDVHAINAQPLTVHRCLAAIEELRPATQSTFFTNLVDARGPSQDRDHGFVDFRGISIPGCSQPPRHRSCVGINN